MQSNADRRNDYPVNKPLSSTAIADALDALYAKHMIVRDRLDTRLTPPYGWVPTVTLWDSTDFFPLIMTVSPTGTVTTGTWSNLLFSYGPDSGSAGSLGTDTGSQAVRKSFAVYNLADTTTFRFVVNDSADVADAYTQDVRITFEVDGTLAPHTVELDTDASGEDANIVGETVYRYFTFRYATGATATDLNTFLSVPPAIFDDFFETQMVGVGTTPLEEQTLFFVRGGMTAVMNNTHQPDLETGLTWIFDDTFELTGTPTGDSSRTLYFKVAYQNTSGVYTRDDQFFSDMEITGVVQSHAVSTDELDTESLLPIAWRQNKDTVVFADGTVVSRTAFANGTFAAATGQTRTYVVGAGNSAFTFLGEFNKSLGGHTVTLNLLDGYDDLFIQYDSTDVLRMNSVGTTYFSQSGANLKPLAWFNSSMNYTAIGGGVYNPVTDAAVVPANNGVGSTSATPDGSTTLHIIAPGADPASVCSSSDYAALLLHQNDLATGANPISVMAQKNDALSIRSSTKRLLFATKDLSALTDFTDNDFADTDLGFHFVTDGVVAGTREYVWRVQQQNFDPGTVLANSYGVEDICDAESYERTTFYNGDALGAGNAHTVFTTESNRVSILATKESSGADPVISLVISNKTSLLPFSPGIVSVYPYALLTADDDNVLASTDRKNYALFYGKALSTFSDDVSGAPTIDRGIGLYSGYEYSGSTYNALVGLNELAVGTTTDKLGIFSDSGVLISNRGDTDSSISIESGKNVNISATASSPATADIILTASNEISILNTKTVFTPDSSHAEHTLTVEYASSGLKLTAGKGIGITAEDGNINANIAAGSANSFQVSHPTSGLVNYTIDISAPSGVPTIASNDALVITASGILNLNPSGNLAINGTVAVPTATFTNGDGAIVTVTNGIITSITTP